VLLRAFHLIRQEVEQPEGSTLLDSDARSHDAYLPVCEDAAAEYWDWVTSGSCVGSMAQDNLPSVKVAMCWHAHMLNPGVGSLLWTHRVY
jgi:hypothetical protein